MAPILNSKYVMLVCLLIGLFATNYEIVRAQTQSPTYQVRIIVDTAKMRTGPGANFPSNGYAKKGDLLTVYQTSPKGDWLLVHQTPDLWVSILQVKMVSKSSAISTKPALTQTNDVSVEAPVVVPSELWPALIFVGFIILGVFVLGIGLLLGNLFSPKVRAVDHVYEPSGQPSTDKHDSYDRGGSDDSSQMSNEEAKEYFGRFETKNDESSRSLGEWLWDELFPTYEKDDNEQD
jgi:hypothetical protein